MGETNTQLVQSISTLAQTMGRDVKDIKSNISAISSGIQTQNFVTKDELKVILDKLKEINSKL
jgi:hypothetical protein|nr:MAG TPA: hypothetical protein [Bacteriophage sp.]